MRRTSQSTARALALLGSVLLAAAVPSTTARASLVKPNGSPPLEMPNTLGLEFGQPSGVAWASTPSKTNGHCSAAAVHLEGVGARVVTAKHCADGVRAVYDEHQRVEPAGRVDVGAGIDLAVLDVRGALPWPGLEPRAAGSLREGERLCAWRFEPGEAGPRRQRICGRFEGRLERASGPPLLKLGHPLPPGTSGSALVDTEGRVVGFVVATDSDHALAEPVDALLAWSRRDEHSAKPPSVQAAPRPVRAPR